MSFFCEGADGSRLVNNGAKFDNISKVKTVDLARFMDRPIDLIKMDIESAEFEVIQHVADKLNLVKSMVIECHVNNSEIDKFATLLQVLAEAKFEVSINSYGAWRDLIHNPDKLPAEFDQYILVAAWRSHRATL